MQQIKVPTDVHEFKHDCRKQLKVPVPKPTLPEDMICDVKNDLHHGHLNYLFTLLYSVLSPGIPEHSGCVHTGIMKWTTNSKVHSLINDAHAKIGFTPINKMTDTQVCILFSLFSHCFISGETSYLSFYRVLDRIYEYAKNNECDEEILHDPELHPFIE